ncbi:: hypothetical protein [Arcticibacter svalbardensis MN12-7]|uniref:Uncharacterized protein n=1 Tax=Arcticibacter svalbardensis MN12-7 TaxID=1150600 RepID=R9GS14_9SPHI|nr:hypothetical protein [Arcticibacter svalbardensis]EOR94516.1 : hypothetical protein [Arcticibacter svalbardensis MN12-7]
MKTVLVPTNFNPAALNCIPAVCNQFQGEKLNFIFVHMFKLSDSISDLLSLSKRNREYELISDEFYQCCYEIKKEFQQIKNLKIEFLYGSTLSMFRNFLEANEVNHILDVSDFGVYKLNKSSIDPSILIKRSGLPVITVGTDVEAEQVAEQRLVLEMNGV